MTHRKTKITQKGKNYQFDMQFIDEDGYFVHITGDGFTSPLDALKAANDKLKEI